MGLGSPPLSWEDRDGYYSLVKSVTCSDCNKDVVKVTKGACKTCYARAWYKANPEARRQNVERKELIRKAQTWAVRTRQHYGHRDRLQLSTEFLQQLQDTTINCAAGCGVVLDYEFQSIIKGTKWRRNAASLDRVNSEKGYITTNVAVICYECNRKKGSSTLEDLRRLAEYVKTHNA